MFSGSDIDHLPVEDQSGGQRSPKCSAATNVSLSHTHTQTDGQIASYKHVCVSVCVCLSLSEQPPVSPLLVSLLLDFWLQPSLQLYDFTFFINQKF